MNIVAVTACKTGIAHTYMAAEELSRHAHKMGFAIKVETQGALGTEWEISADDIASAHCVILATERTIRGGERFADLLSVTVPVTDAIHYPREVLTKAYRSAAASGRLAPAGVNPKLFSP